MPFSCFRKTFDPSDPSPDKSSFYVITTIFNPVSFSSRYQLYHDFAQHMQECGVNLITIEAIFPSLHQTQFQVTQAGNPSHIQIRSNSVYWIKENLINVAVSRLPPHAKWVCWLDGDVTFLRRDWVEMTIQELHKFGVVQVFKKAMFLGPEPDRKVLRTDYSFGYSVVNKKIIDQKRYDEWYPHPGYGWAMSVSTFREIGGLPEYDIVGSGDLHFAFSLINQTSNALEHQLHPAFKSFVLSQSKQTFEKLSEKCRPQGKQLVGFVPVNIRHNWHGSRKNRQYVDRWKILIAHQFDFTRDVTRLANGLLEFLPHTHQLQEDILTHFRIRNEDSQESTWEDLAIKKKKNQVHHVRGKRSSPDQLRRRLHQNHPQTYYVDNSRYYDQPPDDECPPGDGHCPPDHNNCDNNYYCPPSHDYGHHHGHDHHRSHYPDGGYYDSIQTSSHY